MFCCPFNTPTFKTKVLWLLSNVQRGKNKKNTVTYINGYYSIKAKLELKSSRNYLNNYTKSKVIPLVIYGLEVRRCTLTYVYRPHESYFKKTGMWLPAVGTST